MFTAISLVSLAVAGLALSLHRFWHGSPEARKNLVAAELGRSYVRWLGGEFRLATRKEAPRAWLSWVEGLKVWRLPVVEKWVFLVFYGSFLYLAASGLLFAFFVPRGLYGVPLLLHVVVGGVFAACLTLIILVKGKDYLLSPKRFSLDIQALDPRSWSVTVAMVQRTLFWLFAAAGFLLILTALLSMLPWLSTPGQRLVFSLHRYGALASVLAAIAFADLALFNPRR
ncbi:MAG: hypothetical protein OEW05_11580 [Candidatus Aminicenantes bacterium]|nr:hypothetical protein [Candidatus Aminicenantes bacterium]